MSIVTPDLDRLKDWAEELGWVVTSEDPPVLKKLGRTLMIKTNTAGLINGASWFGGDERSDMIPGTASMNRIREWLLTEIAEPREDEPDDDLP